MHIYILSKNPPKKVTIVEKSGWHYLMVSALFNISNYVINGCHVPPDVMHWGHNITYIAFLPNMKEKQIVGKSTQYMAHALKTCPCHEKQKLRSRFRSKETNSLVQTSECSEWSWIGSWIWKKKVLCRTLWGQYSV